ncbi:MAG: NAD(P)H-dependent oxidoreductase [Rhizobiaceae bacterium]|nr:NAD(P)H-dependent oxidoreductase [Rhizobiaceae bacterium]
MSRAPRILLFAGSTRTGAYSGKVADAAQKELALQGAEVTRISLGDFPLPIMNQDLEAEQGVPENAAKLARLFVAHDAVMICTPEYNGSIPPLLKNAIDWISRVKENGKSVRAFDGRIGCICSSSNGHFAGIRSASHLRQVLAHIQMDVIASQVSVPNAGEAFDEFGDFKAERLRNGMNRTCRALIEAASLHMPADE